MNAQHRVKNIATYILLALVALVVLFPLLFALSIAVQGDTVSPSLIPHANSLDFSSFSKAFVKEPLLGRWILNSFVVSVAVTLGQLITSCLAGFALARLKFRGKNLLLFFFLATLMIPWESTIIPNYITIANLHWKDSYVGLVVPFLASGFGIFLMRQSFKALPNELWEAAVMEGCGRLKYLWSIMLPLTRPALATLAIYTFINTWNQYYWPLLIVDHPEWRTTQVGITAFRSTEISSFNLPMAATLIVLAPTIFLLFFGQKQLVSGLTQGSTKG